VVKSVINARCAAGRDLSRDRARRVHRCDTTLIAYLPIITSVTLSTIRGPRPPRGAFQTISFLPHFLTFASLREILFLFVFPCVALAFFANSEMMNGRAARV
jgi:hypothetical protein